VLEEQGCGQAQLPARYCTVSMHFESAMFGGMQNPEYKHVRRMAVFAAITMLDVHFHKKKVKTQTVKTPKS